MADKLDTLTTLYEVISKAICEEKGHRWRELVAVKQPDAAANTFTDNAGHYETCLRCGESRYVPLSDSTTGSFDFTVSGD